MTFSDLAIQDRMSEKTRQGIFSESRGKILNKTPEVIVRHHRAPWATPRLVKAWLSTADRELRTNLPEYVHWRLNDNIFPNFGWVGDTCHHYRARVCSSEDTPIRDRPEDIVEADEVYRRGVTVHCFHASRDPVTRVSELQILVSPVDRPYLVSCATPHLQCSIVVHS
ncbi:hypothetical protein B0T14DRAFT_137936 [Immersiella caudata]|uniref:Uncharacterized protein n=1 Tax=Immersiella caudata TaxID=314043 RepID=A0AA40C7J1_9PEZI|nr:hypothetical protein B0T14DRAFT_137936 [Immersiella caudata]